MDGGTVKSDGAQIAVTSDWDLTHFGDFNGNRQTDLVWRRSSDGS